jgi:hypothetical protein
LAIFATYYWVEQTKEYERGKEYITHGRKENYIRKFGRKFLKERNHWEHLAVHWKIILKWSLKK